MTIATLDTMHGATIALSVSSLTLRVTSISQAKKTLVAVETSYHGSSTLATRIAGDLQDPQPITITYEGLIPNAPYFFVVGFAPDYGDALAPLLLGPLTAVPFHAQAGIR